MSFTSYRRIFRLGLTNFWRNRWLSLAATLMMTLTLLIVSFFSLLNLSINSVSESIRSRLDVEVYFFDDKIPSDKIIAIQDKLEKRSDVAKVEFMTKEKAIENWRKNYELDKDVLDQINNEFNPLPRSLRIKAHEPEQIAAIASFLRQDQFKDVICKEKKCISYNYDKNRETTNKLLNITRFTKEAGLAISALFVLVSILIILNTIRLTIFTRRDEIEIMKLVGASHSFIRYPFVIESMFYGVIATAFSLIIIALGIRVVTPYVSNYLKFVNLDMFSFFKDNIWQIVGLQLIVGLSIGLICSFLSIRKYLRT